MKLVVFICVVIAAEAAKLSRYSLPSNGPTNAPIPSTTSGYPDPYYAFQNQPITSGQSAQTGPGHSSSNRHILGNNRPVSASPTRNSGPSFAGQNHQLPSGHPAQTVSGQSTSNGDNSENVKPVQTDGRAGSCREGHTRCVDGNCLRPEIISKLFFYATSQQGPRPNVFPTGIPLPNIAQNIFLIHTRKGEDNEDPIIIPPPQTKQIIYVLNKESGNQGPKVIEVPTPEYKSPEVYFVNYADGDNLTLPDGTDLKTALNLAIQEEGQVLSGSNGGAPENTGNGHDDNTGTNSENGRGVNSPNGNVFTLHNGNTGPTDQVPTHNGVAVPSGFLSGALGLPTGPHQASTNKGVFFHQKYNDHDGIVTPTHGTTALPQK